MRRLFDLVLLLLVLVLVCLPVLMKMSGGPLIRTLGRFLVRSIIAGARSGVVYIDGTEDGDVGSSFLGV